LGEEIERYVPLKIVRCERSKPVIDLIWDIKFGYFVKEGEVFNSVKSFGGIKGYY